VGATKVWESNLMWAKVDGPLKMFRTAAQNTPLFGYAGPSTAKSTEAFTKYIITDMYAKAVQGMKAEDAVRWAEGELKKVYES
jgi:multiple sugar transport system substrate-binding protein